MYNKAVWKMEWNKAAYKYKKKNPLYILGVQKSESIFQLLIYFNSKQIKGSSLYHSAFRVFRTKELSLTSTWCSLEASNTVFSSSKYQKHKIFNLHHIHLCHPVSWKCGSQHGFDHMSLWETKDLHFTPILTSVHCIPCSWLKFKVTNAAFSCVNLECQ